MTSAVLIGAPGATGLLLTSPGSFATSALPATRSPFVPWAPRTLRPPADVDPPPTAGPAAA